MGSTEHDILLTQVDGNRTSLDGLQVIADFGNPEGEYTAVRNGVSVAALNQRGLLEITGKDRAAWLSNLVTNAVKELQHDRVLYTFALNAKGRILFDFYVLATPDAFWIDVDRRLIPSLLAHFDRYLFSEAVKLQDRTGEFSRLALLGPRAAELLQLAATAEALASEGGAIGADIASSPAPLSLGHLPLLGRPRPCVRTDSAGVPTFELYIDAADAAACWQQLLDTGAPLGARPVGFTAIESLRIESGTPASLQDLNEDILPAETNQFARAVSTTKGCYLGQEIVERMRSRNIVARRYVGLRFTAPITTPAELSLGGASVGVVTSACHSFGLNAPIGLGYVKSTEADPERTLDLPASPGVSATVAPLPLASPGPI